MANTDRIPAGTKVRLPDGSLAIAYPDCGIGYVTSRPTWSPAACAAMKDGAAISW